jgi:hypothetical protein
MWPAFRIIFEWQFDNLHKSGICQIANIDSSKDQTQTVDIYTGMQGLCLGNAPTVLYLLETHAFTAFWLQRLVKNWLILDNIISQCVTLRVKILTRVKEAHVPPVLVD